MSRLANLLKLKDNRLVALKTMVVNIPGELGKGRGRGNPLKIKEKVGEGDFILLLTIIQRRVTHFTLLYIFYIIIFLFIPLFL